MIDSVNFFGLLGGFLTTIAFVPQVIKSWRAKSVKDLSVNYNRWSVSEDVHVGNFNYSKFPIYADLKNLEERLIDNPFIRAINGIESYDQDTSSIVEEDELDEKIDTHDTYQILDADSSQQKAISAAKGGVTYVMHGPPGTGKTFKLSHEYFNEYTDFKSTRHNFNPIIF